MKERHDPLIDACVSCAQFYISAVQKQLDPTKKCSLVRQRFLLQQLFCLRDNTNEALKRYGLRLLESKEDDSKDDILHQVAVEFQEQLRAWAGSAPIQKLCKEGALLIDDETYQTAKARRTAAADLDGEAAAAAAARLGELIKVMAALRSMEESARFQSRLLLETQEVSSQLGYSIDNFAYGSTPYASWLRVFQLPEVEQVVRSSLEEGKRYMVWGSSTGWLVFYGALTYGIHSVGFDLLPSLVSTAQQLANQHQVSNAEFYQKDMLESDLGEVSILMLASRCWDEGLCSLASQKIAEELPCGSLCIDYSNHLAAVLGPAIGTVQAPVSWNENQVMYVFRKPSIPAELS